MNKSYLFLISLLLLLAGCTCTPQPELTPVSYNELPGWRKDKLREALPPLRKTCQVLSQKKSDTPMITGPSKAGVAHDWKGFCTQLERQKFHSDNEFRAFLESHLRPYLISYGDSSIGTFTGYYEPILRGSRKRHGPYQTPLYRLPSKSVNYKIPRSKIVAGALKNKGLEIVWVDDPIGAFFIQIQGSGRVKLDNGQEIRLGYAGQNGFPYFPIGKELLDRGHLKTGQVNMHTIRKWLKDNPRQAESIMSKNQSYVFFKEMTGPGPIGSHGVPLTPRRSMAVDRSFISLGTPLWVDAEAPKSKARLQHMMIAQDTGGAIKGAVRGDYFWGHGVEAATFAGLMNSKGKLYLLLPR